MLGGGYPPPSILGREPPTPSGARCCPTGVMAETTLNPAAAAPAEAGPVVVLGVAFDPLTLEGAVERIERMIASRRAHYVVTPNVDFLVQARRDPALHKILAEANLVLCDGKPLIWAARWLGGVLPGRVAGSDLVPILLQRAAEHRWRVFLLGG